MEQNMIELPIVGKRWTIGKLAPTHEYTSEQLGYIYFLGFLNEGVEASSDIQILPEGTVKPVILFPSFEFLEKWVTHIYTNLSFLRAQAQLEQDKLAQGDDIIAEALKNGY